MTKYLDQNSLSYFWTKIKAYFAKKTEVLHLTGGTLTGPVSGTDLTLSNNLNVDKDVTVGGKITVSDGEYYSMDVLGDEYLYQPSEDTVADASKSYYVLDDGSYEPVDLSGYDNLMHTVPIESTETYDNYVAYNVLLSEWLEEDQTYTLQLWDVDVSHSGKDAADISVSAYYCGGNVLLGGFFGTSYFTDGHADHLTLTFTPHANSVNASTDGEHANSGPGGQGLSHSTVTGAAYPYIVFYNSPPLASGTKSMTIGSWKLEKGLEGSEWTNAVGDFNPSTLGWYEKSGPQPGHGVSFGMPCSEEGFHLGFPLTLGTGENEEMAIRYHGPQREGDMIRFIPNNDNNGGDGIVIGGGGSVIIGGGESAEAVRNAAGIAADTETTYITSDNYINFVTNANDVNNRKLCSIDNDGSMHARNKFSVIEESVTRNTNPSTSQWPNAFEICDKNGAVIGYVRGQFINDNYEGVQLETLRTINGSNYYHGVRFEISNTGAYRTSFNQPASVRTGLGLGSLATKNNVSNGLQCVDISVKYPSAVSAGGTATVNLTHAAIAGKMVFGVGAIVYNGWAWNLVSYDIDGFGVNTAVTIKTYWRATSATAANSITVTVQLLYINANPS